MNTLFIKTGDLKLTLNTDPFYVEELVNEKTGKVFCRKGILSVLIRNPLHVSDPHILVYLNEIKLQSEALYLKLTDRTGNQKAELFISCEGDELKFKIRAQSTEPVWITEVRLTGFIPDEIVLPALGGHSLTKDMTPETRLAYKYPFWWNAQFVLALIDKDGIWLHTKDTEPKFKLFRLVKHEDSFELSLGFETDAPLGNTEIEAEWFIGSFENDWRIAVDRHREWLEKEFKLVPLTRHPGFQEWVNDINFVLEIWGMRKDNHIPHHTFEDMIGRITEWSKIHPPKNTLLYLPGFAEHGIDSHAPDYEPSEACGGEVEFMKLMDKAHELGYRVMLHTNVLAMTFNHPLYEQFREHQVKDVFGRLQGWAMDIDGDWLSEEYFAYINPGAREWGSLMERVIGKLINKYNADAVFLDQTLLAFNVEKGPNFLMGMRDHIARLQKTFPSTLFAGEGINEQVLPSLPMAQIHGIDGLADVHGMELKRAWKKAHPVSMYLFSKYTRFTAHLLTKHPTHPLFKVQEKAYSELDVIPALCLYDKKQKMDLPEVSRMLERARLLNTEQPVNTENK